MNWFINLLTEQSVAHTLLIISLVISFGLAFGEIPFFKIKLGIAGVLFSGLAFGHFGITIDPHIMHFLREFGLILFVYAIGLQVGPGFVNSFLQNGIRLNLMAASIVILGAIITVVISYFGDIEIPVAVGLFSGATTNTPSLAAAQEILGGMPSIDGETLKHPGLGYAVAYPFGIVGIIVTMLLTKFLFKVSVESEAQSFSKTQKKLANRPVWIDLKIENPNLDSLTIDKIHFFESMEVVATRILHQGEVQIVNNLTQLKTGDSIRLVGEQNKLEELKILIGPESEFNLKDISANLYSKRFVVTNKEAIGKTVGELRTFYGVTIPRIQRPEVELTPTSSMHIHFGDELHVVGSKESLAQVEKVLGNSLEKLSHPQIVPIFIGITLGVVLGSWPFFIPGIPSAIKLGLAGGPLIVAIILSRVGNWGAMTWHLPKSSNIILKDIGIVLFLACVGLHSGDQFVNTLVNGDGLFWMACAVLITLLPLLIVAFVAKGIYKMNFLSICGLLAGSMTDPPALAFANSFSNSSAVSIAYATVYPLVMILRIISAQLIILFFIT
ncbi:MAG: putative transporter [Methylomarinum sp.]|nr:putative transporter [Methylomarinum sp.]